MSSVPGGGWRRPRLRMSPRRKPHSD